MTAITASAKKAFLVLAAIVIVAGIIIYNHAEWIVYLAVGLLIAAKVAWWAFLPQRRLPANRVRYQRVRLWLRLHPAKGMATTFQLFWRWGRWASYRQSSRVRPSLPAKTRLLHPAEHSVYTGRAQYGLRTRIGMQENMVIIAPPRTGKSGFLADAVLHAPGPVVSGSTREDVYANTFPTRSKFGRIEVWNPQGIGLVPSTFRWNPLTGCKDPQVAIRRADSFVYGAAGEVNGGDDQAWWTAKASSGMRALFVAAALVDAEFQVVAHWIMTGQFQKAIEILQHHKHVQLASNLTELMGPAERTSATIRMFMSRCVAFMSDPILAQAVQPEPGEDIDIDRFVTGRNTLYLIGEAASTEAPLASLYVALTSEIQFRAVQLGSKMPGSRLDPPMLLALDEVAQTVPVPLRNWMADGSGKGIPCMVVIHGVAQLRSRYGDDSARSILDTAGCWLVLGGVNDDDTLQMVEKLCGEVALPEHGNDSHARHPVISVEQIRQLPTGFGLLIRGSLAPVIVKLPMVWNDRTAKRDRRQLKRKSRISALMLPPMPSHEDIPEQEAA